MCSPYANELYYRVWITQYTAWNTYYRAWNTYRHTTQHGIHTTQHGIHRDILHNMDCALHTSILHSSSILTKQCSSYANKLDGLCIAQ